ncbi:MAG: glycerol-3-phosphate acyltransferase [Acidimicrobiia bacterium]
MAGSIPFAWLVGKAHGIDLRDEGSGNVGTGNVAELTNWWWGLAVFVLDVSKAAVAILLAEGLGETAQVVTAWGVITGHAWPVWLRFIGGRGQLVALVGGGLLAPFATAGLLPILGVGAFWKTPDTRPGHRSHLPQAWLVAVLVYPLLAIWLDNQPAGLYAIGVTVLTIVRRLTGSPRLAHKPFRQAWRTRLIWDAEP